MPFTVFVNQTYRPDTEKRLRALAAEQPIRCSHVAFAEGILIAAMKVHEQSGDPDIIGKIESLLETEATV